jgi:hypothetical protein
MRSFSWVAAVLVGFTLGAVLFHTPTVKAQGKATVQSFTPGMGFQKITGTPIGISCLNEGQQGAVCYILTQ